MQIKRYRSRSELGSVGREAADTLAVFEILYSGKHMLSAEALVTAVKEVDRLSLTA
jgi:hypothetical protein